MFAKRNTRGNLWWIDWLGAGLSIVAAVAPANGAEKTIYEFHGGAMGSNPHGPLARDAAGNLYGTTAIGGGGACPSGCGTIFKISTDNKETVLHEFQGGGDGGYPYTGLVADSGGNFYGTTNSYGVYGNGTIFKLAPDGTETVLYAFQGGSDGGAPSGLTLDSSGNLYGTTVVGGNFNGSDCDASGCGTVFELQANGNKTTLYDFQGGSDGYSPLGGVVLDSKGDVYGTTYFGDGYCGGVGCGTVFEIKPDGSETVLYAFPGGQGGAAPVGVTIDSAGNLYGMTAQGGDCTFENWANNCGTIFKLATDGTETMLYNFEGGKKGLFPLAPPVVDANGNLYGTTKLGGIGCQTSGCGVVFELASDGTERVLHAFREPQGRLLETGLLSGVHGLLYGVATEGGRHDNGVVFSVGE